MAESPEEQKRIESRMREDPVLLRILEQLKETNMADDGRDEKERKLAERQRRIESDIAAPAAEEALDATV